MSEPSLREIQAAYFDGLEEVFGGPFSEMKKHGVDCADIAIDLASRDRVVRAFESDSEGFFGNLAIFWDSYREIVDRKLADAKSLKAVYGGDLSPSYVHNVATSTGLYMDTVVIPDPVLRIGDFRTLLTSKDLLYFTAKHALNALSYRDLALADVDPPIVVITDNSLDWNRSRVHELTVLAETDVRIHFEKVFARRFDSYEQLLTFLTRFSSIEQFVGEAVHSKRVLFDSDWPDNVVDQFRRHRDGTGSRFNLDQQLRMKNQPPGLLVADFMKGRLMQTNDIILSSDRLNGTPLVDAPTSWQYLVWKYEYDIDRADRTSQSTAHTLISRALQSIDSDDKLRLLRTSPEVLIELRRNGVMEDLREMLRSGIDRITTAASSDLEGVTLEIAENVNAAMLEHQKKLDDLARSGIRWYGFEVVPLIVSASVSILGAATGNIPLATAGAVANALGLPTPKAVIKSAGNLVSEYKKLRNSASGILFRGF